MARRSKKNGNLLEAAVAIAAAVGFVSGLQWPGSGNQKLYTGAAGAFIGAVLVLILSFLLASKKRDRFYDPSDSRRDYLEPWLKEDVDQYPLWKERVERATQPSRDALDAAKWSLDLLRALEWHRVELLAQAYFQTLGIKAELTPFGPDGGVDINLYSEDSTTLRAFVQCKAQVSPVSVNQVRELYGVMSAQGVGEGIFITTGTFTSDARAFAQQKMDLIDGQEFVRKILDLSEERSAKLLRVATSGDFMTPTCPSCGIKMIDRISRRDGSHFWGCKNYPRCNQVLNRTHGLK